MHLFNISSMIVILTGYFFKFSLLVLLNLHCCKKFENLNRHLLILKNELPALG